MAERGREPISVKHMKHLMLSRYLIDVWIAAVLLGGCSSNAGSSALTPAMAPSALALVPANAGRNLYVANFYSPGIVTVYSPGKTSVLRTISHGMKDPRRLAFDASSNLYVSNADSNTVSVYLPGKTSVLRTISQGIKSPSALAFDASENLCRELRREVGDGLCSRQQIGIANDLQGREITVCGGV
jgi:hypothetical protein